MGNTMCFVGVIVFGCFAHGVKILPIKTDKPLTNTVAFLTPFIPSS
jgi:hypothetical protein